MALFLGPDTRGQPQRPLPTELVDFFQPGSQPNGEVLYDEFVSSSNCRACHAADNGKPLQIYAHWQGSMMAQAARDPLFYACLAVANQDAAFAGDLCIRCHTPGGWISGRSEPTDGSALTAQDRDGVACSVCHRMVDPVFKPGVSPAIDASILAALSDRPTAPGGGTFVLDPDDRRRGPYTDPTSPGHLWLSSPFHRSSDLCGTCHDVSNPVLQRQPDGTYQLNLLGQSHPTVNKYDMFPLERTYSEWLHSDFARTGVDLGGRFGGSLSVVRTCQDCHMPKGPGKGCFYGPVRDDLPAHDFAGGNAWVQDMILNLYPNDPINSVYLAEGKQRSVSMLQRACSLELTQNGSRVIVRVINETGHKLPSGYPEGRRMWLEAVVKDESLAIQAEWGAYDPVEAMLHDQGTKVYEMRLGLDAPMAAKTGLPVGEGFHFALNNVILKDNRIPPRGFANDAYRAVQAAPVDAAYADGQFWDDTLFRLPAGAAHFEVRVFYQTASRKFIEFLRDENTTNQAGEVLYEQWNLTGRSPPVLMAEATLSLQPYPIGDADGDGQVDLADFRRFDDCLLGPLVATAGNCDELDLDADADVDLLDTSDWILRFSP